MNRKTYFLKFLKRYFLNSNKLRLGYSTHLMHLYYSCLKDDDVQKLTEA